MNFSTSLAAATGNTIDNVVITPEPALLTRKIAIFGACASAKLGVSVTALTPIRVFSAEQVGQIAGTGTQAHRLAINAYKGHGGSVETWLVPLAEGGSDVAASSTIVVTASSAKSGTIALYINNDKVAVTIDTGKNATEIAASVASAINADATMPISASAATGTVTVTAKTKGTWGNDISLAVNLAGETLPEGVSLAITQPSSGSDAPVINLANIETALGSGDNRNEKWFTALIHGNNKANSATLDAFADYVGRDDEDTGCYSALNGRFPRVLVGSADNDLNAEIAISDTRKNDRANGILVVPNTLSHPAELAALAMAIMEQKNSVLATNGYFDTPLPGVMPGSTRWSDTYTSRDTAVKTGVAPTMVKSGSTVLQNVITFYRPDTVPVANNGYRSMRNISVLQNISSYVRSVWDSETWKDIIIVKNANEVYSREAKRKAKDIQAVKNQILAMGSEMLRAGWIYSIDSIVEGLKDPNAVTVLPGGKGFKCVMPVILSGEGGITDMTTKFDINFGRN